MAERVVEKKVPDLQTITKGVDECSTIATNIGTRMDRLLIQKLDIEKKYDKLQIAHSDLEKRAKESVDKIKELDDRLEEALESHGSDNEARKLEIAKLTAELKDEQTKNKELEVKADSAKQNLSEIGNYSDSLKNKIDTLKKELTTIQGNLSQEGGMRHKQHGGNKQMNVTHYRINY